MRFSLFAGLVVFLILGCSGAGKGARGYHDPAAGGVTPELRRVGPDVTGGSEVGPGGDLKSPEAGAAWFVSATRQVSYCLTVAPDFGASPLELRMAIEHAFAVWRAYVDAKQIRFSSSKIQLALWPHYHGPCDGAEDLRFYFGTDDDTIRRYKAFFTNPIAFPVRLSFHAEDDGSWSRGLIWVAKNFSAIPSAHFPDWSKPEALGATLRHELGHLLGIGHVPGTVMSESIDESLRELPPERLAGIDFFNELYRCVECPVRYTAVLPALPEKATEDTLSLPQYRGLKAVYPLLHRPPVGAVRVTLLRNQGSPRDGYVHSVRLEDQKGAVGYEGSPANGDVSEFPMGLPLFNVLTRTAAYHLESTDLEYRQTFYPEGKWEKDPVHLTIRYLTHYFDAARQAPVQLLSDKSDSWLAHYLFRFLDERYPLAEFALSSREVPRPGEYKVLPSEAERRR